MSIQPFEASSQQPTGQDPQAQLNDTGINPNQAAPSDNSGIAPTGQAQQQQEEPVDLFSTYFQTNASPFQQSVYQPPQQQFYPANYQPQTQVQYPNYQQPVQNYPQQQLPQQQFNNVQQQAQVEAAKFDFDRDKLTDLIDDGKYDEFANVVASSIIQNIQDKIDPQVLEQQILQKVLPTVDSKLVAVEQTKRVNNIVSDVTKGLSEKGVKLNQHQFSMVYDYMAQHGDNAYANYVNGVNHKFMFGQALSPSEVNPDGSPFSEDQFFTLSAIGFGERIVGTQKQPNSGNKVINQTVNPVHSNGMVNQVQNGVDLVALSKSNPEAYKQYAAQKGWKTL